MKGARSFARQCLVQALYEWQLKGDLDDVDTDFIVAKVKDKVDKKFFDQVLYQVVNQVDDIDQVLTAFIDRPVAELDLVERAILRLGACELKYYLDIPYRVIINESVELAKQFGADQSHKYINGVLDKIAGQLRPNEINK